MRTPRADAVVITPATGEPADGAFCKSRVAHLAEEGTATNQ
jgi:hypothetical protein